MSEERDRELFARMDSLAIEFRQHTTAPIQLQMMSPPPDTPDNNNTSLIERWFGYIAVGWKVGAVLVIGGYGWANLNNDIKSLSSDMVKFEEQHNRDITTVNAEIVRNVKMIYDDLDKESKNLSKEILYADSVINTKIDTLKTDMGTSIEYAKKDIKESFKELNNNVDSSMATEMAALTSLNDRFISHEKKANELLSVIPETININSKLINEKVDKLEDAITLKFNDINTSTLIKKAEIDNLHNEFKQMSDKVDGIEKLFYRPKGNK